MSAFLVRLGHRLRHRLRHGRGRHTPGYRPVSYISLWSADMTQPFPMLGMHRPDEEAL